MTLDFSAPIIPLVGSAGLLLGNSLDQILKDLPPPRVWTPGGRSLVEVIRVSEDSVLVDRATLSGGKQAGSNLYCLKGAVELKFNRHKVLCEIALFEGYQGLLFDEIKIGDKLSNFSRFAAVVYDEGDEMHYPIDESGIQGLGLIGSEESLEDDPDQVIVGISVFKKDLMEF